MVKLRATALVLSILASLETDLYPNNYNQYIVLSEFLQIVETSVCVCYRTVVLEP